MVVFVLFEFKCLLWFVGFSFRLGVVFFVIGSGCYRVFNLDLYYFLGNEEGFKNFENNFFWG